MLTSPALNEMGLETAFLTLMEEWLSQWFDGGTHTVGAAGDFTFPKAVLGFQQSPAQQPLNPAAQAGRTPEVSITMVWGEPSVTDRKWWDDGQERRWVRAHFTFYVRAEGQAHASGNARKLCREAAEKLHAILDNAACRRDLTQKGVMRLRPGTPQAVAETSYSLRRVACTGTLACGVRSQL